MTYGQWCALEGRKRDDNQSMLDWWRAYPPTDSATIQLAEAQFKVAATFGELGVRLLWPKIELWPPKGGGEGGQRWFVVQKTLLFALDNFPLHRRGLEYWDRGVGGEGDTLQAALDAYVAHARLFVDSVKEEIRVDREWGESLLGKRLRVVRAWSAPRRPIQGWGKTAEDQERLRKRKLHPDWREGYASTSHIESGMECRVIGRKAGAIVVEFPSAIWYPETLAVLREFGVAVKDATVCRMIVDWNMWDSHSFSSGHYHDDGTPVAKGQPPLPSKRIETPYFEVIQETRAALEVDS